MTGTVEARIVILNYEGEALLPLCLPSIVEAANAASTPTRITVLDNLSRDKGLDYVRSAFPEVDIVVAGENRILCSYNDYLPSMAEPVAILLNNDIRVDRNFVDPLMEKFKSDPATFLVAPRVMSFDGSTVEAGRSKAGMRWGLFWCEARYRGYEKETGLPSETFSSGFGAFDRRKFVELGGYDDRFLPGILEDVDLCVRAKKAGYRLYYEPASAVFHIGQASFKKKFGKAGTYRLAHRNNFLFMWKNFNGIRFWLWHLFFLPLRLAAALLKGNTGMVLGFFDALKVSRK